METKEEKAKNYAKCKSSSSVFREAHIKDYLAGYEQCEADYATLKQRHDKALDLLGELTLRFECLKKSFELLGKQTQQQEKPINKK